MNNKYILIYIILFPLLFPAFLITSDVTSSNQIRNSNQAQILEVNVDQINFIEPFEGENSPVFYISVTYDLPPSESNQYINFVAKSSLPPFENIWIGQNIELNSFDNIVELKYTADMNPAGVLFGIDIQEISMAYVLSNELIKEQPFIDEAEFAFYSVGEFNFNVGSNGIYPNTVPDLSGITQFIQNWVQKLDSTWIYRGCTVPNIDLDDSTYPIYIDNSGNVVYMGDANACATAACANSIAWLDSQHPEINTGMNTRELISTLDQMVERSILNQTPKMEDVISGTLDLIDSLQIPVSVKFQSLGITDPSIDSPNDDYGHSATNHGTTPGNGNANQVSWDWIQSEMEAGEDVTMVMSQWTGTAWGSSHAVTLTGISKDDNNKKITFKDDSDQLQPGGTSETQIDVNVQDGWLTTNYMNGAGGTQIITAVVSKSYDASVTFTPTSAFMEDPLPKLPTLIFGNYPNPFNLSTRIYYYLNEPGFVSLHVYDVTGRLIQILENEMKTEGEHIYDYDAKELSSGVYYLKLTYGKISKVIKTLLLK